jgi:hypothetical protein
MPLNLAQTAISVLRLGENALTAIYSGIVRVYPNEVTVSIDGANASTQSGTPGQSMNNLIYTVNPSSGSTSGWTAAQISAATLTGLPAGFTATFSASGGLGSQVGTWTINTTDGLLPAVDTAIAVGSLTSTIAQTGWGSINVSIQGLSYWNNGSGTITGFVGSTGSVGASGSTVTVIGVTIATLGTGFTTSNISGQSFTSSSQGGIGSSRMSATFNYTVQSTGSVNSSVSVTSNNFPATNTANVIYEIPGPPWNVNPTSGVQCFTTNYYQAGTPTTDGRIQTRSIASWTGTSSGSVTFAGGGISGSRQPQSYQNNSMRPGSGSYTITTESNFGQSNSGTYVTQNSVSWNWN